MSNYSRPALAMFPKVTIVTPTYNRADLIAETIESILAQDYPNFEYIIIDDGSTDNTAEVVARYGDRVTYCYHENRGEAASTNRGWQLATGDYFAMVSSDDPMLPGWLTKGITFMEEHPEAIVGYPDWNLIDEKSNVVRKITVYEYDISRLIGWLHCLPGPGSLIRRSALVDLKDLRLPKYRYVSDLESWFRLALYGQFVRIPETLAAWRDHPDSTSIADRSLRRSRETLALVDEFFKRSDLPREVRRLRRYSQSRAWYLASVFVRTTSPGHAMYFYMRSLLLCRHEPDDLPPELHRVTIGSPRNLSRMLLSYYSQRLTARLIRKSTYDSRPVATNKSSSQSDSNLPQTSPLVSVVIPTFNRAGLVEEAVQSALDQTFADLEVIVADDGSTDDTIARLKKITDPRLRVIGIKHGGASAARNRGSRAACGKYIAFLDSDDLFEPEKVERGLEQFRANSNCVLVHSAWTQHDLDNNEEVVMRPVAKGDARHQLLMFSQIATPTVMVKRSILQHVGGFDEDMFLAEDYDLWCRISAFGEVGLIEEPLTRVRLHNGNSSRDPKTIERNQIRIIKRFFSELPTEGLHKKNVYVANSLYWVGILYFEQGHSLRGAIALLRATLIDPGKNWSRGLSALSRQVRYVPFVGSAVIKMRQMSRSINVILDRGFSRNVNELHSPPVNMVQRLRSALRAAALIAPPIRSLYDHATSLRVERDGLQAKLDEHRQNLENLQAERDALGHELEIERAARQTQVNELQHGLESVQAERDVLRKEYDRVATQAAKFCSERDGLLGSLDEARLVQDVKLARILGKVSILENKVEGAMMTAAHAAARWVNGTPAVNSNAATKYLDLLENCLVGNVTEDVAISPWSEGAYDPDVRLIGRDWPAHAQTMIGVARMRNLRMLLERAIATGVPGDFIETGVWRGGACIYARGIFAAHNVTDRKVWVADSFSGLPPPNPELYPADAGDKHHTVNELAVPLSEVRANFSRYSLLDDQVVFLKGWFKDTLPVAPIEKLAILRLDGDMYESTMDALNALYHKLVPGGFVIIDDYLLPACRQAVDEFRKRHNIAATVEEVDGAAVFWQKR